MESAPTAFAVLDILGYGKLMRREPDEILILIQELLQASARFWTVQRDLNGFAHFSNAASAPVIESLQFSDTLLIWLRSDPLAPNLLQAYAQLVESVCYAASLTLAYFIAAGLPLRGAVGFGPAYISRDPLFFTGYELYETTKLERKQAWAGAALHDSAAVALSAENSDQFIEKYPVPMSEAAAPKPTLAVDWVTCLLGGQPIIPPWDQMFSSEDQRVRKKGEATRRFFEAIEQKQRQVQNYLAHDTVTALKKRLSGILSDD